MFKKSVGRILSKIGENDRVLDVGAWAMPFPRADYVIDILPYETRGRQGNVYDDKERFTEKTWIIRDVCDREPFPFPDKFFDFAICSHVLEDIRDPIFVAKELRRISKRGYIETPSRLIEQTRGVQHPNLCGYHHHRWIVENWPEKLSFTFKDHLLYESWRYHLHPRMLKRMTESDKVMVFFWENHFEVEERFEFETAEMCLEFEAFQRKHRSYSKARYALLDMKLWLKGVLKK